jgi:hypothetical protein
LLELFYAQNLLGSGSAKKWVLLANSEDPTMMRNMLASKLGAWMGMTETPDMRFVELEINKRYQGVYVLAEKVELAPYRVEAPEGTVLMEADFRRDDSYFFSLQQGVDVVIKQPKAEKLETAHLAAVQRFVEQADAAVYQNTENWLQYFDADALVCWFLAEEILKNLDAAMKTSVFFCVVPSSDPLAYKIRMGPIWDFDHMNRNPDPEQPATGWATTVLNYQEFKEEPEDILRGWYSVLTQRNDFMNLVKAKYSAMAQQGVWDQMDAWITSFSKELELAQQANYAAWPDDLQSKPWEAHVQALRDFFYQRRQWLDEQLLPG